MKVNKTDKMADVLAIRLTEYHYYESIGYKGYVDADCSFAFELVGRQ